MNERSSRNAASGARRRPMAQAYRITILLTTVLLTAVVALPLAGCRRPGDTGEITGTITFKGEPLDQGTIQFVRETDPPQVAGGAAIRAGRYRVPGTAGVSAGRYKVLISSPEIVGDPGTGDPMLSVKPINKERIPSDYNSESHAFAEVRSDGTNQFDFAIP